MRRAFADTLCALAVEHDDIVLIYGDLGFSVLEPFREHFPGRSFNAGVAEQNMMGMAAGLASAGKVVLTYSIANFAVTRCLEQFRNDACYHDLPVIAVSVGAGVSYGSQGYTHHGIEDIGFTRTLPHVAVVSPGDALETQWALRHLVTRRGPACLRLGKGGEPLVHEQLPDAPFGAALALRSVGRDVTILAHGAILAEARGAVGLLVDRGVDAGLFSMPVVEPLDVGTVQEAARASRLLVSVEEHVPQAGFGGAVAEVLAGIESPRARLLRAGIERNGASTAGDQVALRRQNGLDAAGLAARIVAALEAS
jgi:transketolase